MAYFPSGLMEFSISSVLRFWPRSREGDRSTKERIDANIMCLEEVIIFCDKEFEVIFRIKVSLSKVLKAIVKPNQV